MRILLLIVVLSLPICDLKAQTDKVYIQVDKRAFFRGGLKKWSKFLDDNVKYPEKARLEEIEGDVRLSFIVNKDGSLSDIVAFMSPHELLSKEAMRVLKLSDNKWVPAKQKGSKVRSRLQVQIHFQLK